jgi:hypothetical protein
MIIDIDKIPLIVLPANHLLFKENKEVLEIANTNQKLKKLLITVSVLVVGVIISNQIIKKENERREED